MDSKMDVRCITLGTRPYVHIEALSNVTGVKQNKWMEWIMDSSNNSVAMVRTSDGLYIEESAISVLIERKCTTEVYMMDWKRWISNRNAKRRLTEAEKKAVAAEQRWHCALCDQLFQIYEVDHIEQFCIRGNNDRRNLQALCCDCHAIKTRKDREYGDALFEKCLERSSSLHGKNGNIFSQYFNKTKIKSSLESNGRRFDEDV